MLSRGDVEVLALGRIGVGGSRTATSSPITTPYTSLVHTTAD